MFSGVLLANDRKVARGQGTIEEDLSAPRQLDRRRGLGDILAMDMTRERVESLEGW